MFFKAPLVNVGQHSSFSSSSFARALFRAPRAARIDAMFDRRLIERLQLERGDDGRDDGEHGKAGQQRHAQPFPVAPESG